MKLEERDKLLIRLEERTVNIWHVLEKLERHQDEQNGFIKDALLTSAQNTAWRKATIWFIGGLASAMGLLFAKFQGLW